MVRIGMNSTLLGTVAQLVLKAQVTLITKCLLRPLWIFIQHELCSSLVQIHFQDLSQLWDGFGLPKRQEANFAACPLLQTSDDVDDFARNYSLNVDEGIQFLSYLMLKNLNEVISNDSRYSLHDTWPSLEHASWKKGSLPMAVATYPESISNALSSVWPQTSPVRVVKINEGGDVVVGTDSKTALKSLYRTRLQLLSVTYWAELKQV